MNILNRITPRRRITQFMVAVAALTGVSFMYENATDKPLIGIEERTYVTQKAGFSSRDSHSPDVIVVTGYRLPPTKNFAEAASREIGFIADDLVYTIEDALTPRQYNPYNWSPEPGAICQRTEVVTFVETPFGRPWLVLEPARTTCIF